MCFNLVLERQQSLLFQSFANKFRYNYGAYLNDELVIPSFQRQCSDASEVRYNYGA